MKKTTNSLQPRLNFDIISKILNIRMQMKKDDRYKKQFDEVMYNFKIAINSYKDEILIDKYGYEKLYRVSSYEEYEDLTAKQVEACLDNYELHDFFYGSYDLLSSIEDDLQINYLNDYI
jgi:hypothetical protein